MNSKIRSFMYLDEHKMYSISSQLFEGLTEYILKDNRVSNKEEDLQKGNFGSGRVMSEILQIEKGSSEKRFLHDYAYNLFEKELTDRNILFTPEDNEKSLNFGDKQFVKVKGKIIFNDFKALRDTFRDFNDIGTALGYIQCYDVKGELMLSIDSAIKETNDRNVKAKIGQEKKKIDSKFKQYLLDQGLNVNSDWLSHLQKIYEFGYKDLFSVRMPYEKQNIIFESILNRKFLKEDETSLIVKYSRRTEVEFSIMGLLTQKGGEKVKMTEAEAEASMKIVSLNFTNIIGNLEESFNGRLKNEYIIDPIAIYREV